MELELEDIVAAAAAVMQSDPIGTPAALVVSARGDFAAAGSRRGTIRHRGIPEDRDGNAAGLFRSGDGMPYPLKKPAGSFLRLFVHKVRRQEGSWQFIFFVLSCVSVVGTGTVLVLALGKLSTVNTAPKSPVGQLTSLFFFSRIRFSSAFGWSCQPTTEVIRHFTTTAFPLFPLCM